MCCVMYKDLNYHGLYGQRAPKPREIVGGGGWGGGGGGGGGTTH